MELQFLKLSLSLSCSNTELEAFIKRLASAIFLKTKTDRSSNLTSRLFFQRTTRTEILKLMRNTENKSLIGVNLLINQKLKSSKPDFTKKDKNLQEEKEAAEEVEDLEEEKREEASEAQEAVEAAEEEEPEEDFRNLGLKNLRTTMPKPAEEEDSGDEEEEKAEASEAEEDKEVQEDTPETADLNKACNFMSSI